MNKDIPPSLARLEGQLERAIGRELKRASALKRSWRARPRVLAGTTIGIAAIATVLALALTAASSPPAFAVTRNHDGTVSVRIMRLSGVAPANARLAAIGIHARLVAVRAHCASRVALPPPPGRFHPFQTRIRPDKIPRGRTLVLGLSKPGLEVPRSGVYAVPAPVPQGIGPRPLARAVRSCFPPPPACAWRGATPKQAPLPLLRALHKARGLQHGVAVPRCVVALAPPPKPEQAP